jgi:hypothetical protein
MRLDSVSEPNPMGQLGCATRAREAVLLSKKKVRSLNPRTESREQIFWGDAHLLTESIHEGMDPDQAGSHHCAHHVKIISDEATRSLDFGVGRARCA